MKTLIRYIGIFLLTGFFVACGEGSKKDQEKSSETPDKEANDQPEKVELGSNKKEDRGSTNYVLPSPLQIASIFKKAGLAYKEGLIREPGKASDYVSTQKKKMMFGVYSADLSYLVLNDRKEQAMEVVKSLRSLADELGLVALFNSDELTERFRNNLNNRDSLANLLVEVQENFDEYVNENGASSLKVVSFTGAWVESMYLGAKSTDKKNKRLEQRLVEQMQILKNLLKGLKSSVRDQESLKALIDELEGLYTTMNNMEEVQALKKGEKKLPEIELSKEDLKEIKKRIVSIREQVVET